jgi:hypothetical protein
VKTGVFRTLVSVNKKRYEYNIKVEQVKIGDRDGQVANPEDEDDYWQKFDSEVGVEIMKLVLKVCNGHSVNFPVDISSK